MMRSTVDACGLRRVRRLHLGLQIDGIVVASKRTMAQSCRQQLNFKTPRFSREKTTNFSGTTTSIGGTTHINDFK